MYEDVLKAPGSTYSLLPGDPVDDREAMLRLLGEYLPEQAEYAKNRPHHAPNPNLLILLNIARMSLPPKIGTPLLTRHFEGYADGSFLNRYGPARMIAVMNKDFVETVLPRATVHRKRLQGLSEGLAKVVQVAGGEPTTEKLHLRGLDNHAESAARTALRAKEAGIKTPRGRGPAPIEWAPSPSYLSKEDPVEYHKRAILPWHRHYLEVHAGYQAGEVSLKIDRLAYKRYVNMRRNLLYENRQHGIVHKATSIQVKIEPLDERLRKMKAEYESGKANSTQQIEEIRLIVSTRKELIEKLKKVAPEPKTQPGRWLEGHSNEARYLNDNGDGNSEPLLLWDRRPYEPLGTLRKDTDTPLLTGSCAVVDIQPDPSAPVLRAQSKLWEQGKEKDSEAITLIWFHLCRLLVTRSRDSFSSVLKQLFPTRTIPELVRAIPALQRVATVSVSFETDANGKETPTFYYQDDCMASLLYRNVSTAIFWAVAEEWHKWPFKPVPTEDLHRVLGGGSVRGGTYRDDL